MAMTWRGIGEILGVVPKPEPVVQRGHPQLPYITQPEQRIVRAGIRETHPETAGAFERTMEVEVRRRMEERGLVVASVRIENDQGRATPVSGGFRAVFVGAYVPKGGQLHDGVFDGKAEVWIITGTSSNPQFKKRESWNESVPTSDDLEIRLGLKSSATTYEGIGYKGRMAERAKRS